MLPGLFCLASVSLLDRKMVKKEKASNAKDVLLLIRVQVLCGFLMLLLCFGDDLEGFNG